MATTDYVEEATARKCGRPKWTSFELNRDIKSVCLEVSQTPLYSVALQGHDQLFQEGFEISNASSFFTRPPNLCEVGRLNTFVNLSCANIVQLSADISSKLSPITMYLSSYFKFEAQVEKDVGKFYQDFLGCFIDFPFSTEGNTFSKFKPIMSSRSVDGLFGRSGNGNRPVAKVKNSTVFREVYVVAVGEDPDEDLKTVYQPVVQICAFSEMCTFRDVNVLLIEIYGDENTFRSFMYFHEHDVLLTTDRPFTFWYDGCIHLRGLALLCLLFQLHQHPFHQSTVKDIRVCGWKAARLAYCPDGYRNCELLVEEDEKEKKNRRNPNVGPPLIPKNITVIDALATEFKDLKVNHLGELK